MTATVVHLLYTMVLRNKSLSARPGIIIYGNICALVKLTYLKIVWGFSTVFSVYFKYYFHFGCQFYLSLSFIYKPTVRVKFLLKDIILVEHVNSYTHSKRWGGVPISKTGGLFIATC